MLLNKEDLNVRVSEDYRTGSAYNEYKEWTHLTQIPSVYEGDFVYRWNEARVESSLVERARAELLQERERARIESGYNNQLPF